MHFKNPEDQEEINRLQSIRESLQKGDRVSIEPLLKLEEKALIQLYDYLVDQDLLRRTKFETEIATEIIYKFYQILRYAPDPLSSKSWISPSGKTKIKLLRRNLQFFKGGRGHWAKTTSIPLSQAAANLVQKAGELFGTAQAERIAKRKITQKEKLQHRKQITHKQQLDDAYSLYTLSANLESEERAAWLAQFINSDRSISEILGNDYYHSSMENLDEIHRLHSILIPPLFTQKTSKKVETTINIAGKEIPLTYQERENKIIINIGGLPIDPLYFRPSFEGFGQLGAVGYIKFTKEGPIAHLAMIIAGESRRGVGRELLRAFCRAVRAYGTTKFIALGMGEEGMSFLNRLHQTGEITILNKLERAAWLISCQDIFTPEQYPLFKPLM